MAGNISQNSNETQTNTQSQATGQNSSFSSGAGTAYSGAGNALNISGATVSGETGGDVSLTYNVTDPADQALVAAEAGAVQDSAALASQAGLTAQYAVGAALEEANQATEQAGQLSSQETKTPIQQLYPIFWAVAAVVAAIVIF